MQPVFSDLLEKRCILVAGAGGVGKTTLSATLAIQAARHRKRVLVLTIDPAKRLAEAFGILGKSMDPVEVSAEKKALWGIPQEHVLAVSMLNPKQVIEQILGQSLNAESSAKIKSTVMYQHLSEMISGLQEYTAYEYVTRILDQGLFDLVVLDTPPATHAKDFFKVPERITRLMESKVFQIFVPKKPGFISGLLQNSWIEKILGARIFSESRIFFEAFSVIRDRILQRCQRLQKFFADREVSVVVVAAPHESAWLDLTGLEQFLKASNIPIRAVLLNQVEAATDEHWNLAWPDELKLTWQKLHDFQNQKAQRDQVYCERAKSLFPNAEIRTFAKQPISDPDQLLAALSGIR